MSSNVITSTDINDSSNLQYQHPIALQPVKPSQPANADATTEIVGAATVIDENNGPFAEVVTAQQAWNDPRINIWRVAAVFLGFLIMGMNDACYGPLIPSIESYFSLSYTVISLIFLFPFFGYILAAFISDKLHMHVASVRGARELPLVPP